MRKKTTCNNALVFSTLIIVISEHRHCPTSMFVLNHGTWKKNVSKNLCEYTHKARHLLTKFKVNKWLVFGKDLCGRENALPTKSNERAWYNGFEKRTWLNWAKGFELVFYGRGIRKLKTTSKVAKLTQLADDAESSLASADVAIRSFSSAAVYVTTLPLMTHIFKAFRRQRIVRIAYSLLKLLHQVKRFGPESIERGGEMET